MTSTYLKWGVCIRPAKGVDVLIAAFLAEQVAIAYARSIPESKRPFLRWLAVGVPPPEKYVTDGEHYL